MKIALIILSITIIAIQAVPVPKEEDVDQFTAYPRRHARDLNDEKLAKQSSVKDDFDLDQAEADPRKIDQSEGRRYKRSPLVELTSELLLAKHTSGSDGFKLAEDTLLADPEKIDQSEGLRYKRSVFQDLVEEEGDARKVMQLTKLNKIDESEAFLGKEDKTSRNKRSPVAPLVELTSELLKHTSGSNNLDLGEEEGDARVNSKEDNHYRHIRSEAWDLQEEE